MFMTEKRITIAARCLIDQTRLRRVFQKEIWEINTNSREYSNPCKEIHTYQSLSDEKQMGQSNISNRIVKNIHQAIKCSHERRIT